MAETPTPQTQPQVVDDRDLVVGRVYAEAILKLAEERGQSDALLEEFDELVKVLDRNPKLRHFFSSQMVDAEGRVRVIDELLGGQASDLLLNSLQVINSKGRLAQLRAVIEAYRLALYAQRGWIDVHVRSAVPLNDAQRTRLRNALADSTGKKPVLIERIDPSLLGGLVVVVEGKKYDASVASWLQDLSATLLERASREIISGATYVVP